MLRLLGMLGRGYLGLPYVKPGVFPAPAAQGVVYTDSVSSVTLHLGITISYDLVDGKHGLSSLPVVGTFTCRIMHVIFGSGPLRAGLGSAG